MATIKVCEYVHPTKGLQCERSRNHTGKCRAWTQQGTQLTWKDPEDGPDSLKNLLRF